MFLLLCSFQSLKSEQNISCIIKLQELFPCHSQCPSELEAIHIFSRFFIFVGSYVTLKH